MELINRATCVAQVLPGMDVAGVEHVVIVAKVTYSLPSSSGPLTLAAQQRGILAADRWAGEPNISSPLEESEHCLRKPACDVVLNGTAYAPDGKPVPEFTTRLQVGEHIDKTIRIVGERAWHKGLLGIRAGAPIPLASLPLDYVHAFGGIDTSHADEARHARLAANPIGRGFRQNTARSAINGLPMPQTEEPGRPVVKPSGEWRPMAYGPLSRAWAPRQAYAGTFDQHWEEEVAPFLPSDFDERFHQCAPEDQRLPHPRGDLPVALTNLTPDGSCRFVLPAQPIPILVFCRDHRELTGEALVDTIVIEPDAGWCSMTWRLALPLRRSLGELGAVVVGPPSQGWLRARRLGKTWYPDADRLILSRRLIASRT